MFDELQNGVFDISLPPSPNDNKDKKSFQKANQSLSHSIEEIAAELSDNPDAMTTFYKHKRTASIDIPKPSSASKEQMATLKTTEDMPGAGSVQQDFAVSLQTLQNIDAQTSSTTDAESWDDISSSTVSANLTDSTTNLTESTADLKESVEELTESTDNGSSKLKKMPKPTLRRAYTLQANIHEGKQALHESLREHEQARQQVRQQRRRFNTEPVLHARREESDDEVFQLELGSPKLGAITPLRDSYLNYNSSSEEEGKDEDKEISFLSEIYNTPHEEMTSNFRLVNKCNAIIEKYSCNYAESWLKRDSLTRGKLNYNIIYLNIINSSLNDLSKDMAGYLKIIQHLDTDTQNNIRTIFSAEHMKVFSKYKNNEVFEVSDFIASKYSDILKSLRFAKDTVKHTIRRRFYSQSYRLKENDLMHYAEYSNLKDLEEDVIKIGSLFLIKIDKDVAEYWKVTLSQSDLLDKIRQLKTQSPTIPLSRPSLSMEPLKINGQTNHTRKTLR